jgi:hypothetical protein
MLEGVVPPVLIIAWRRPEPTRRVIESVRSARPTQLFLAVDGPRGQDHPNDAAEIRATIDALESAIDWPCEVRKLYATENQGCRLGVTAAIDWFFSSVEMGIILEDDCVAHPDFFPYCAELLERFRHDTRVLMISGDNSAAVRPVTGRSYSFIPYAHIWGWATWRRAWALYDRDLSRYRTERANGDWGRALPRRARRLLTGTLDSLAAAPNPGTWDYQWASTIILERGLSVHPRSNLITNIGFGPEGTHTRNPKHPRANAASSAVLPLSHPRVVRTHHITGRRVFAGTHLGPKHKRGWRKALRSSRSRLHQTSSRIRRIPGRAIGLLRAMLGA